MTAAALPTPSQTALLNGIRRGAVAAEIVVRDDEGRAVGVLSPITDALAADAAVVDSLYRWRAAAMRGFLTVFAPTPEKTRAYLHKIALADPTRILFLVRDLEGRPIGNIGLCNVAPGEAEVDNVVRGERVPVPGFMIHVQRALVDWASSALGSRRVYLNVLSDNPRAIESYRRAGYVETGRTPLAREDTADGYRLTPMPGAALNEPTLVRMELPVAARMA